jgi:hypothetical protein
MGGITAATSVAGGITRNQAIRSSMRSVRNAEAIQVGQLADQASFEQTQAGRRASRTAASLRVALAAAGRGDDLGGDNAIDQVFSDGATDIAVIEQNQMNNVARVRSGTEAEIAQLRAAYNPPFFNVLNSVLSGVQVGLGTFQAVTAINGAIGASEATQAAEIAAANATSSNPWAIKGGF